MNNQIYLERISYPITNLGPGKRIGIWVQGCSFDCPGCMSPHLKIQKFENLQPVESIARSIVSIAGEFDGLTISGGEPFEQADALAELIIILRQKTDLDVLVYSGYSLDEIRNSTPAMQRLLDQIDMLIDSPFVEHLPNTKIWRGSDNQIMHLLTPLSLKYQSLINTNFNGKRQLQIEITRNGEIWITGIPERNFFFTFKQQAKQRGLILKSS